MKTPTKTIIYQSTTQVSHPAFGAGIEPNAEMEVPWAGIGISNAKRPIKGPFH